MNHPPQARRPGGGRQAKAGARKPPSAVRRSKVPVQRALVQLRRAPVQLRRALSLGHRVLQRDTSESLPTADQKLRWQRSRQRFRRQEHDLEIRLAIERKKLSEPLGKALTLWNEAKRIQSEDLARRALGELQGLTPEIRRLKAIEQRFQVTRQANARLHNWLADRESFFDDQALADHDPDELYERFFRETLLAQPLPQSLGQLSEELRGHIEHLEAIDPTAPDFPQIGSYQRRIEQLIREMRRMGVTADEDTLYTLVKSGSFFGDKKPLNDARIRRTPRGTLSFGEKVSFRVEPFYLPPGSRLEVAWRWRPLGGREARFFGMEQDKTRQLSLTLDESFWGWVPGPVLRHRGMEVVAYLYLDGEFQRRLTSEWVPFQEGLRRGLRDEIRVLAQPRRTIPGAAVTCRLASWIPPGLTYQVHWLVNGEVVKKGPRRSLEQPFEEPGLYEVAAHIYQLNNGRWTLFHATPGTSIEVSAAPVLGRRIVDHFEKQGLPAFSSVRPGLQKTLNAIKKRIGKGDHKAHWQRRLETQQKRQDFLEREVPEADKVLDGRAPATPPAGSRHATPIAAVLLHPEISGPVPLSLFLVLHYRQKGQWEAKILDLTDGEPRSHRGSGGQRQEAVAAALAAWQSNNPYPKGGTVTFRLAHWQGRDHFSTSTFWKSVKDWVDTVLLAGGVVLLAAPEFTGSKALGYSLLLASLARSGYAIYENLTLGVPWYDSRNLLEALAIVGSVAGLSGSVMRAVGSQTARTGVYRSGTALVLFGLGTDISSVVVVTYQGMAMLRAIQDDPTLDAAQKANQLVRISSMLILNGVMTFAANRDLFTSPRGSLAARALDPANPGSLGPRSRQAMELEIKRRGRGKELRTTDGAPISDRRLLEVFCQVRADQQRLQDVQAELGSDRARREFGRLMRSKRRHRKVDMVTRVRLSRALEVPVHLDPELPGGSVRVHYEVHHGAVGKLQIRIGPETVLDDVLRHAPTVRLLKRYRGLTGKLRSHLDRLRKFFGAEVPNLTDGLAFEAWGELLKLPGLIAARRQQLIRRDLQPGDRARLEAEIETLRSQWKNNLPRVEKLARRRGYIAVEGDTGLQPHLQTVEQRWQLGDTIPPHVLAEPDHHLYDTHRRAWGRLRRPYLGSNKIKAPYGDEHYQLSWEKEGKNALIYLYYRPKGISDQDWFRDMLKPGKSLGDLASLLRNADSSSFFTKDGEGRKITGQSLRDVIHLTKLKEKAEGARLSEMIKTSFAHPKMDDSLKMGGIGEWEITHRSFEEDIFKVIGNRGQIRWIANRLGNHGFHLHVSFPRPTNDQDIADLLTLVAHLNNYEALRIYGQSGYDPQLGKPRPGFAIGQSHLGIMDREQLHHLHTVIKEDGWAKLDNSWSFKWHFVAVRQGPYQGSHRIGIEFRTYRWKEGTTPTVEILGKSLDILKHPKHRFSFQGTPKYTLKQLRAAGLVPAKSVLDKLPRRLAQYLEKAAAAATALPDDTVQTPQAQLLARWSVPFLDWKKHPAVPQTAHEVIDQAHATLVEKLLALANTPPTAEAQPAIQQAIAEWAKATSLWRYF